MSLSFYDEAGGITVPWYGGWFRNPNKTSWKRWFIPLLIGFQHVATILSVVQTVRNHPQYFSTLGLVNLGSFSKDMGELTKKHGKKRAPNSRSNLDDYCDCTLVDLYSISQSSGRHTSLKASYGLFHISDFSVCSNFNGGTPVTQLFLRDPIPGPIPMRSATPTGILAGCFA